jgi:perosamine synthetase
LSNCNEIIQAVEQVLGQAQRPALLHAPTLTGQCSTYTAECVETAWVSTAGAFVTRFEDMLCEITGAKHAVAIVNGTCALQLVLHAIGVGPGDEVLCPTLSFVATANAISHCHATPHFIDSDPQTLGLCPDALRKRLEMAAQRDQEGNLVNRETGQRIAAVVPMHVFGHPCQIEAIMQVASDFGLPVIEDAAESLGSFTNQQHTGRFGLAGVFSFNGNKIVTCGGGGAIVTEDDDLAATLKHLSTTAKQPHPWDYIHDAVGYNYRMPNLNAALGCGQLEYFDELLAAKRSLAHRYRDTLADIQGVTWVNEPAKASSNFWLNAVVLEPALTGERDNLLQGLSDRKIQARPIWCPLHQLPIYKHAPRGEMTAAESLGSSVVNLPSSAHLDPALNPPRTDR